MPLVPIVAPYTWEECTWELWSLNVPPLMIGLIAFESIVTSNIKIVGDEGKELFKVGLRHRLIALLGFQGCTWRAVHISLGGVTPYRRRCHLIRTVTTHNCIVVCLRLRLGASLHHDHPHFSFLVHIYIIPWLYTFIWTADSCILKLEVRYSSIPGGYYLCLKLSSAWTTFPPSFRR